jgi:hypothetical protein
LFARNKEILTLDAYPSRFTELSDNQKILKEFLKFITFTKFKLDIVFPEFINPSIVSQVFINLVIRKKIKDNMNIKLLYYNTKDSKSTFKRIPMLELNYL